MKLLIAIQCLCCFFMAILCYFEKEYSNVTILCALIVLLVKNK